MGNSVAAAVATGRRTSDGDRVNQVLVHGSPPSVPPTNTAANNPRLGATFGEPRTGEFFYCGMRPAFPRTYGEQKRREPVLRHPRVAVCSAARGQWPGERWPLPNGSQHRWWPLRGTPSPAMGPRNCRCAAVSASKCTSPPPAGTAESPAPPPAPVRQIKRKRASVIPL